MTSRTRAEVTIATKFGNVRGPNGERLGVRGAPAGDRHPDMSPVNRRSRLANPPGRNRRNAACARRPDTARRGVLGRPERDHEYPAGAGHRSEPSGASDDAAQGGPPPPSRPASRRNRRRRSIRLLFLMAAQQP